MKIVSNYFTMYLEIFLIDYPKKFVSQLKNNHFNMNMKINIINPICIYNINNPILNNPIKYYKSYLILLSISKEFSLYFRYHQENKFTYVIPVI